MKTAVVILNWNTEGFLRDFLPGLLQSVRNVEGAEVIVADNASSDGSMTVMKEMFPQVRTIAFDKNYGFTGGYNRAFEQIDSEYFVLINSDIEVPQDWLGPLVDWMDTHPECGACAPKLHSWQEREKFEYAGAAGGYIDLFGYPFCRGRVLKRLETDMGQYDTPADVFWATGACLMVRSSLYRRLGGLDERFFAHMEEIDLCWRMQLEGFKVTVVPESVVYHLGGGTLPASSPFKLFLMKIFIFCQHFSEKLPLFHFAFFLVQDQIYPVIQFFDSKPGTAQYSNTDNNRQSYPHKFTHFQISCGKRRCLVSVIGFKFNIVGGLRNRLRSCQLR